MNDYTVSGAEYSTAANQFSDLVYGQIQAGLPADVVLSIAITVIGHYAVDTYGSQYLDKLSELLLSNSGPKDALQ